VANTSIDRIGAIALYVDKQPPSLRHGRLYRDGERVSMLDRTRRAGRRGTRIYLDGRLLTTLSRQAVREALLARGESNSDYAFSDLFTWLHVDEKRLVTAHFVARDNIALELAAARLRNPALSFALPPRSRGRMRVGQHDQHIDALLLFSRTRPADRSRGGPRPEQPGGVRPRRQI
jgi:hypothetical protein